MIELTIQLDQKAGRVSTRCHPPMNPLQILAVCRVVENQIIGGTMQELDAGAIIPVSALDVLDARAKR